MCYANPKYIMIAFWAAIFLGLFYFATAKRRRILMERFADKNLIKDIAPSLSSGRKFFKTLFIISAVSLAVFSLARPQWGFEWQEVRRTGLDILIAMDVSKSMLARDVKPNRLERSKFAVKDLVRKLNGDRIGLIAFAGSAFLQCPLTIDYDGFILALDDLNTETIPRPGTSIANAIKSALDAFSAGSDKWPDNKHKILVIITDGEELEGNAVKAAEEAARSGMKVYCVGVGTPEGELIPAVDERGERAYMADKQGAVIKTRMNEELLKKIAIMTGSSYVRATQSDFGLVLLYDKSISKLEKMDIETKMRKHYEERFQLFLALAVIFLFIEPLISERKALRHE